MTGAKGADRARRAGLSPLIPLAAVLAVEAGERSSLAQAVDGIQDHFHVSDFAVGLLPAAMTIIGTLGGIPFGHLADRVRRTWLLAGAIAVWTAVMGLNAIAPAFAFLFIARVGVGIVEANGPAAVSLLSDYFPVRDRARVLGLWQSGSLVGSILGLALGGVLVDQLGWRAAFWMWIPFGAVVVILVLRMSEPRRGDADAQAEAEAEAAALSSTPVAFVLPPPVRTSSIDYRSAPWRECYRELLKIRSMWFALIGITVSNALLWGISFWAVEYFKRTYGLSASAAGAAAAGFGLGAAVGMVGGGFVADHYLKRGVVNARIYVVAVCSVMTTVCFMGGFAATALWITVPFLLFGAIFLTAVIAPNEAVMTDVVVAPMRGRAAAVRGIVRSISVLSAPLIGMLADVWDIRVAFLLFTPVCAIGGLIVLAAARSYPEDLAFVLQESRRLRELEVAAP